MSVKVKCLQILSMAAMLSLLTSCMTTYDAYGRPVQTVDPALAVAGVAAAGLIGYAIADGIDDNNYRGKKYHRGNYYGRSGGYRYGSRCGSYYY